MSEAFEKRVEITISATEVHRLQVLPPVSGQLQILANELAQKLPTRALCKVAYAPQSDRLVLTVIHEAHVAVRNHLIQHEVPILRQEPVGHEA